MTDTCAKGGIAPSIACLKLLVYIALADRNAAPARWTGDRESSSGEVAMQ